MTEVIKTVAAVAYSEQEPFKVETVELELPRGNEIHVKVAGVGLCHTDLVFKSDAVPYPKPAILGHEGAGTVVSVGSEVTKVKPGDRVIMTFRSCGECDHCHEGNAAYCRTMPMLNFVGRRTDGSCAYRKGDQELSSNFFGQSSFSSIAVSYERNLVKVEDDQAPLEILGPLACGIQTGVGAVTRSLSVKRGSSIAIFGGGSVGLSAVMGAVLQGCLNIILIEPVAERRLLAKELGATHVIDPVTKEDVPTAIKEICSLGVNYVVETTGNPNALVSAMASVGSMAVVGLVGVMPANTQIPMAVNDIVSSGITVRGIIEGDSDPDVFIPELLQYFKAGRLPFDKLVKTYPLKDINLAVEDQHKGRCVKAVLLP